MEMRRIFFNLMVMNLWNSLPQTAVEAKALGIFKVEMDRFLINKGVKGYSEKGGE